MVVATHKELERKLIALEQKYDKQFKVVFDAIRALMSPPEKPRKKIGFEVKEPKAKRRLVQLMTRCDKSMKSTTSFRPTCFLNRRKYYVSVNL